MIYLNTWSNNVLKLDLIYKINIINSYNFPYLDKLTVNVYSKFIVDSYLHTLRLITVILLLTGQKPVVYSLRSKKHYITNVRTVLRKRSAFDFLILMAFSIIPNLKNLHLSGINKTSSLSIVLDNLTLFPQLNNQYYNFYNNIIILNISFDLLRFNILNLIISGFLVKY